MSSRRAIADSADDSVQCQNPGTPIANNPADITGVHLYLVPDYFATPGNILRIDTRSPFQELLDTSFSGALSVRAVRANGERENRIVEVHDETQRIGAVDDNNNVIDGTADQVGFSDDGHVLVNLPLDTARVEVRSFHTATQTDPVACDSVEVTFEDLLQSETLGDLLESAGITLCPPLDTQMVLDMPLDRQSAGLVILGLMLSPGASAGGTHLGLANPDVPHHPIFNPFVWLEDCEGIESGA